MASKTMLHLWATVLLLFATVLLFTARASSLDDHEELKIKVSFVKARPQPLIKAPAAPPLVVMALSPPLFKPPSPPYTKAPFPVRPPVTPPTPPPPRGKPLGRLHPIVLQEVCEEQEAVQESLLCNCMTCCNRCHCVLGNRERCGKCYTDMVTHGNSTKCPWQQ